MEQSVVLLLLLLWFQEGNEKLRSFVPGPQREKKEKGKTITFIAHMMEYKPQT